MNMLSKISEFFNLASADEQPDDPLHKITKLSLRLVLFMIVGVFGLMALIPIEGAVIGTGQIAVESRVKTISHPFGGVLSKLNVRDGDRVKKGDILMRFDNSVLEPTARSANLSREQLLARQARLEAERDGAQNLAFPAELTYGDDPSKKIAMEREQQQFAMRRTEQTGTLALLRQRINQYQQQIRSFEAQIAAADRQLELIEPELEGLRGLFEKGLVTVNRLNQMERTAVQLTASKASLRANIAQSQAQISETREQILNVSQTRRVDAAADLSLVLSQLNDQDSRLASAQDSLDRSVIKAPQAGIVDKLAFTTIGSAIPAGQPLAQIVPDQDILIIEAQISPGDVDQLTIGQTARVRFSTIDAKLSPEIAGKLNFIAAERSDDPQSGVSFYQARIAIEQDLLEDVGGPNLRAGVPVEVFLQTGSRSILTYLVQPLLDQIRHALR